MLRAICYVLYATCYMLRALCYVLYATCYMLCAICYVLYATCYVRYRLGVLPAARLTGVLQVLAEEEAALGSLGGQVQGHAPVHVLQQDVDPRLHGGGGEG